MDTRGQNLAILIGLLFILSPFLPALDVGAITDPPDSSIELAQGAFLGEKGDDELGSQSVIVGDVNGDNLDDLLMTAYTFDDMPESFNGKVYLVFGKTSGWTNTVYSSTADASFVGVNSNDYAGVGIDGAGDINGDGYDDLIIGSYMADQGGTDKGAAYIIFGKSSGWSQNVSLNSADVIYSGEHNGDRAGYSVAGVGDVNGDGYDDVMIGAWMNSDGHSNGGQAYLIFGRSSGWPKSATSLSSANASFLGEGVNDNLGSSISGAGDVNNDGFDDMIIGSKYNSDNGAQAGKAYIIAGGLSGWSMDQNISSASLASYEGVSPYDHAGSCVSDALDINADGYDDVLIGASQATGMSISSGGVYVIFGGGSGWSKDINLSEYDLLLEGESNGDALGKKGSCSGAGDVNGDGYSDMVVGAMANAEHGTDSGQAYLVLGGSSYSSKKIDLGSGSASSWYGIQTGSYVGSSVSGMGDLNGDGYDDILVGAEGQDYLTKFNAGKQYVLFPDSNTGPGSANTIKLFKDPQYSSGVTDAEVGSKIYIELVGGTDVSLKQDIALVDVTSTNASPMGIRVRLLETGPKSNIYHGYVLLENRTRETHNWIRVLGNETLTVTSVDSTNISASLFVLGNFRIKTNNDAGTAIEDSEYRAQYWAEGSPDFDLQLSTNATWLSLVSTNLTGTPDNSHVGSFQVDIMASNQYGQSDSKSFTLVVMNTPPTIEPIQNVSAYEDEAYTLDLNSSDDGQGSITWSVQDQNGWLNIDPSSGTLNGTPTNDEVGDGWVTVTVEDGNGGLAQVNFTLTVINTNDPPVITSSNIVTAIEDEPYRVTYLGSDVDAGDSFSWDLATNASSWLSIGSDDGILEGTPTNDEVGTYWVNVSLVDRAGSTDSSNFTLKVENVNDAPTITSQPLTEATANMRYMYQVEATDIDVGDVLQYWFDQSPDGMVIDADSGEILWTPTTDQGGDHDVKVRAGDGNTSVLQSFTITVTVPIFYPPLVHLISPMDTAGINITNPELIWSSEDPDSPVVYFDVFLGVDRSKVEGKDPTSLVAEDTTNTLFIPSKELLKGDTYYWTVTAFDGEYSSDTPDGVWSFTILSGAVISKKPTVVLNEPMDASNIDSLPVQLRWSGADPDSQTIYYSVYLSTDLASVQELAAGSEEAKDILDTSLMVKTLELGKVYYWTVIPNDGKNIGTSSSGIWSFEVIETVARNHPPFFNSTPVTEGFVGHGYQYQVDARDDDAEDILLFSLPMRPKGMVIDSVTGLIVWNPTEDQEGPHTVIVMITDGSIHVEQEFTVLIRARSEMNHPPTILGLPQNSGKVGKLYKYQIAATDLDMDPLAYSIDEGPPGMNIDPDSGLITWTPVKGQSGPHDITIMVSDGKDPLRYNFTIDVMKADPATTDGTIFESLIPWILLLAVLFVATLVAVASRRKGRGARSKVVDGGGTSHSSQKDAAKEQNMGHGALADQESTQMTQAVIAPAPAGETAADDTVEDFSIREIFLIYNDGRLITHSSINADDGGLDKDLISGMLVAIQGFVKESFESSSPLDSFEFGNNKVVLQGGQYLVLAVVMEGTEPSILREEMRTVNSKIEGLYAGVIENWNGETTVFSDVRQYLLPLFTLRSRMNIKTKKKRVRVRSGIEFYSGYVRLKVGIENDTDDPIADVRLTVDYDHTTLRLSRIEPDLPISDSTVYLPGIDPSEKRSVAVYFDPMICQESHIDAWVDYTDAAGNPLNSSMKRRPVDVVCPIFYTTETINVAMLRRLLKQLPYKDSKIFEVSDIGTLKRAYSLAVSTVKAHDVKFVREFKRDAPYEGEAWFFGEAQESEEKFVIKVSASADLEFLEIFVASGNLASMTGLLAELGNRFDIKVKEEGLGEGAIVVHTDPELKSVIRHSELLLDKYAETNMVHEDTEE